MRRIREASDGNDAATIEDLRRTTFSENTLEYKPENKNQRKLNAEAPISHNKPNNTKLTCKQAAMKLKQQTVARKA